MTPSKKARVSFGDCEKPVECAVCQLQKLMFYVLQACSNHSCTHTMIKVRLKLSLFLQSHRNVGKLDTILLTFKVGQSKSIAH